MDTNFKFIEASTFYPLFKNFLYSAHGANEIISRNIIHYYEIYKQEKGVEEASKYLDGFTGADEFKSKVLSTPYKTPLVMDAEIRFSNVKPIDIDTEEIFLELGNDLLTADGYSNYLAVQMQYLILTSFSLTSERHNQHKEDPLWLFFRYIRNAAAHGNEFYFKNLSTVKPTEWNGITIDKHKQGCKLFKTMKNDQGVLNLGDVMLFLIDLERDYQIKL